MDRRNVDTGTPWEKVGGYSRAVRIGNHVWVSGTTASDAEGAVHGENADAQARYILEKIAGVLAEVGASLNDVVRTRIYVARLEDWEAASPRARRSVRRNPPREHAGASSRPGGRPPGRNRSRSLSQLAPSAVCIATLCIHSQSRSIRAPLRLHYPISLVMRCTRACPQIVETRPLLFREEISSPLVPPPSPPALDDVHGNPPDRPTCRTASDMTLAIPSAPEWPTSPKGVRWPKPPRAQPRFRRPRPEPLLLSAVCRARRPELCRAAR